MIALWVVLTIICFLVYAVIVATSTGWPRVLCATLAFACFGASGWKCADEANASVKRDEDRARLEAQACVDRGGVPVPQGPNGFDILCAERTGG